MVSLAYAAHQQLRTLPCGICKRYEYGLPSTFEELDGIIELLLTVFEV